MSGSRCHFNDFLTRLQLNFSAFNRLISVHLLTFLSNAFNHAWQHKVILITPDLQA